MRREIVINDIFHDIADIFRYEYVWEPTPAPDNLLHGHGYYVMAGNSGFKLLSYKDDINHFLPTVLNRRYGIGTMKKAETPFHQ